MKIIMKVEGVATLQHYIPQFLLKSFKVDKGKKDQIFVLDKRRKKIFLSNVKNIAGERYFYNFKIGGEVGTVENFLSKIESDVKLIIQKIVEEKSFKKLASSERYTLAKYICIQYLRTKNIREANKDLILEMVQRFSGLGISEVDDFDFNDIDEKVKVMSIELLLKLSQELIPCFQKKLWFLMYTENEEFFLSDVGIILRNSLINPVFGDADLGLASKGIEIYFPVSPRVCIVAICPSLLPELEKVRKFKYYDNPGMTILGAIENQSYFHVEQEFVKSINKLQLFRSEQFIFSKSQANLNTFSELIQKKEIKSARYKFY